jgi:hypothetical protein
MSDVTFIKYIRLVLPADGFVFWVRASILSGSSAYNESIFSGVPFNYETKIISQASSITVKNGSFHVANEIVQEETSTYSRNQVLFTSPEHIQDFTDVNPGVLWIATNEERNYKYRFGIGGRSWRFEESGIHHYTATTILPEMATQIVDTLAGVSTLPVVSNSIPLWLLLNTYQPPYPGYQNALPLYPSFQSPLNLPAPYGIVHVVPGSMTALQLAPSIDSVGKHSQLIKETVRITLLGTNNNTAMDFVDTVNQYSLDTDNFGICGIPAIVRDDRIPQPDVQVIAMRKTVEFEISYNQVRVESAARQLITTAIPVPFVIDDFQEPSAVFLY